MAGGWRKFRKLLARRISSLKKLPSGSSSAISAGPDMQKALTIHVGFEKTGSTTVQKFLFKNRDQIAPQILYPRFGGPGQNHIAAYRACLAGSFELEESSNASEINQFRGDNIVLSCEHFSFLHEESLKALEHLVKNAQQAGMAVHIVAAVRESLSFLQSLYLEAIKWGIRLDFNDFTKGHIHRLWASRLAQVAADRGCRATFVRFDGTSTCLSRLVFHLDPRLQQLFESSKIEQQNVSLGLAKSKLLLEANRILQSDELRRDLILLLDRHRSAAGALGPQAIKEMTSVSANLFREIQSISSADIVRNKLFNDGRKFVSFDGKSGAVVLG